MPLMQRFMKFVAGSGMIPDARLLELYPPFMPMRIKVLEIARNGESSGYCCHSMRDREIPAV